MSFIPTNNTILCEQIEKLESQVEISGFAYKSEQLPKYKILKKSDDFELAGYEAGDVVITDSIPTKFKSDEQDLFIIRAEHVAGKVC